MNTIRQLFHYSHSIRVTPKSQKPYSILNQTLAMAIKQSEIPNLASPYYINPSDNLGNSLVTCILTGNNYLTWARATRCALRAKNKLGFMDSTIKRPDQDNPEFNWWDIYNNMIMSWMFNSLDKTLQGSVAFTEDAKTMWD